MSLIINLKPAKLGGANLGLLRGLFLAAATVATGGLALIAFSDLQGDSYGCDGGSDDDG